MEWNLKIIFVPLFPAATAAASAVFGTFINPLTSIYASL